MGNGEKWWETVRNGEKRWETGRDGEKRWDTVRDGERRRETMRDGERRWGISAHIHRSIQVILAYKHRHCQTPPDTTRHAPDTTRHARDVRQWLCESVKHWKWIIGQHSTRWTYHHKKSESVKTRVVKADFLKAVKRLLRKAVKRLLKGCYT